MWRFLIVVTGMIFVFCESCVFSDLPHRYIDFDPEIGEFIGEWKLTNDSKKRLDKEGINSTSIPFETIIFGEDSIVKVPFLRNSYFKHELQDVKEGTDTLYGNWNIKKEGIFYAGKDSCYKLNFRLDFYDENNISVTAIYHLYIAKEKDHFVLWNYIGDPDHVLYQDYKRK